MASAACFYINLSNWAPASAGEGKKEDAPPSENEGVDADEEGSEAQREQLEIMIFPVSPGGHPRLHEITTEGVAGGWSREGELALHANS